VHSLTNLRVREALAPGAEKGGEARTDEGQVSELGAVREVEEVEGRAVDGGGGEGKAVVQMESAEASADEVWRLEKLAIGYVKQLQYFGGAQNRR